APPWRSIWTCTTCSRACSLSSAWSAATESSERFATESGAPSGPLLFGALRALVEDRDALDVCRVREHVHHPGGAQGVVRAMHEQPGVACQGRGVAAHIDDAPRRRPRRR